jgi:D-hydroxyproline dehydrogenase subunit gamma
MHNPILLMVNEKPVMVPENTTVAAAITMAGAVCRISVTGEPRGPVCGMGICLECRASIDGVTHQRTCQILCRPGMDVRTQ